MRKKSRKPRSRRSVLRLRDLDQSKAAVLNSLASPASRRAYEFAIDEFIAWYCSEPRLSLGRVVVTRFRMSLEERGLASASINQRLAAVRSEERRVGKERRSRCPTVSSRNSSERR